MTFWRIQRISLVGRLLNGLALWYLHTLFVTVTNRLWRGIAARKRKAGNAQRHRLRGRSRHAHAFDGYSRSEWTRWSCIEAKTSWKIVKKAAVGNLVLTTTAENSACCISCDRQCFSAIPRVSGYIRCNNCFQSRFGMGITHVDMLQTSIWGRILTMPKSWAWRWLSCCGECDEANALLVANALAVKLPAWIVLQ